MVHANFTQNAQKAIRTVVEYLTYLEVVVVSAEEVKYSAFIDYTSSTSQTYSVFSGFVFTAITILLSLLPDPSTLKSQLTLLFLMVLFSILNLKIYQKESFLGHCVKISPPLPEGARRISFWLSTLSWVLFGSAIVLMFFLWNLLYLTLTSVGVYAFSVVFAYLKIRKPLVDFARKTKRSPVRK